MTKLGAAKAATLNPKQLQILSRLKDGPSRSIAREWWVERSLVIGCLAIWYDLPSGLGLQITPAGRAALAQQGGRDG